MDDNKRRAVWPAGTLLAPVPAALVSCGSMERPNALTIGWTGIICSDPAMTYISVRPERYSHGLITQSGVFAVNLTTADMARAVDFCGVRSGRDTDKIKEAGLHTEPAKTIDCPIISESPLTLECVVKKVERLGSHDMFIAEISAVNVQERFIDKSGRLHMESMNLMAYAHGEYFELGRRRGRFGFSVRKKDNKGRRRVR